MKRPVLLAALLAGACNKAPAPPPTAEVLADSADQVIVGFRTEATDQGARLSYVEGDSAWFYQSSQTYVIKGMKVIFPDSTGRTISTITSKNGQFRSTDQSLDARDSVVGTTPTGRVLKTEHLIWDKRSNEIASDTAFTLTSPTGPPLIRGRNFTATPDFQTVRVNQASGLLTRQQQAAPRKKSTPARKPAATPPAAPPKSGGNR